LRKFLQPLTVVAAAAPTTTTSPDVVK
jgi:hypothetical protein